MNPNYPLTEVVHEINFLEKFDQPVSSGKSCEFSRL